MKLSILTVQPGSTENVMPSNFECRQVVHKANFEAVI